MSYKILQETNERVVKALLLIDREPHITKERIARLTGLTPVQAQRVMTGKLDRIREIERCPRCSAMVEMPCRECCIKDRIFVFGRDDGGLGTGFSPTPD